MRSILALVVILLAPAMSVAAGPTGAGVTMPVDLELLLTVDVSGRIDDEEVRLQWDDYVRAITNPAGIKAVKSGMLRCVPVTYFEWAGEGWQSQMIDRRIIDDKASAAKFAAPLADAMLSARPWTSISGAIDHSVTRFAQNNFDGTRRGIDISGDGPDNTVGLINLARDDAVASHITINGPPIMNDRFNISRPPMPDLDLYYRDRVIGGPTAFLVVADNFKDFARAIRRKLILGIAGLTPTQRRAGPRLMLATGGQRKAPPCDIGEERFRGLIDNTW